MSVERKLKSESWREHGALPLGPLLDDYNGTPEYPYGRFPGRPSYQYQRTRELPEEFELVGTELWEREEYDIEHISMNDDWPEEEVDNGAATTYAEIGQMLGVTGTRIQQIEAKALKKIRKYFERFSSDDF